MKAKLIKKLHPSQANETFEEFSSLSSFSKMWLDFFGDDDEDDDYDKIWSRSSDKVFQAAIDHPFVRQMLRMHEEDLERALETERRVRVYKLVTSMAREVKEHARHVSLNR